MLMQILSHSKTDFLVAALQNVCTFLLIDMQEFHTLSIKVSNHVWPIADT